MSISAVTVRFARRCGFALAVMAALALGAGACPRHAEAPAVIDAAPDRTAAPAVRDAAVDHPIDAPVDAPPDAPGPPHGRAHRATAAPRPPAAGGFKIEGSISKADAETVLRGARGKLNACYETEHAKTTSLAGRVTFRLSIDGRGRVPLAEVLTSTLGGGDPELCMVEALRDLTFPPSSTGGESTLTFPMTFGR
jgi:hypothetical protein